MGLEAGLRAIMELYSKGITVPLKKDLLKLEEQAIADAKERADLKAKNEQLEAKLREMVRVQGKARREDGVIRIENDPDPFCPICHQTEGSLTYLIVTGATWKCGVCKNKGVFNEVIQRFNESQRLRMPDPPQRRIRTRY